MLMERPASVTIYLLSVMKAVPDKSSPTYRG
jgi:hypothetical protein